MENNTNSINTIFRWLPDFTGKQRLGRLFFKKQIKQIENVIITGGFGLKYRLPNIKENIGYEIFINGIYEKETSDFIINNIPDGGIYVDIGANIGSIAIPGLTRKKNVKGICIEASKTIFSYLAENIKLNNLDNILLVNKAISSNDDELVHFYSPKNQFGKGHFSKDIKEEIENVVTIKLDSLLKNNNIAVPNIIKIDIEGYEYYAFERPENLLDSNRLLIFFLSLKTK
ncbi:MAG: FkbM family methyltransferase [Chitinophagaceae bacterium]|nr:FkbM family methyltransferase [Chitinophagaceae bacterium]